MVFDIKYRMIKNTFDFVLKFVQTFSMGSQCHLLLVQVIHSFLHSVILSTCLLGQLISVVLRPETRVYIV